MWNCSSDPGGKSYISDHDPVWNDLRFALWNGTRGSLFIFYLNTIVLMGLWVQVHINDLWNQTLQCFRARDRNWNWNRNRNWLLYLLSTSPKLSELSHHWYGSNWHHSLTVQFRASSLHRLAWDPSGHTSLKGQTLYLSPLFPLSHPIPNETLTKIHAFLIKLKGHSYITAMRIICFRLHAIPLAGKLTTVQYRRMQIDANAFIQNL